MLKALTRVGKVPLRVMLSNVVLQTLKEDWLFFVRTE